MAYKFQKVAVSAGAFAAVTAPDVNFGSRDVSHLEVLNEHATCIVEFSLDGTSLDGEMDPALPSRGNTMDGIVTSAIWFRVKAGSTGPANVSVYRWTER